MRRPWMAYLGCLLFIFGGIYFIMQGRSTVVVGVLLAGLGAFTLFGMLRLLIQSRRAPQAELPANLSAESIAAIRRDAGFRRAQRELQQTLSDINERYGKLRESGNFASPAANALLATCYTAMRQAEALKPQWNRYGIRVDYCSAYKANAVICEKRGEHMFAAQACVRAIRAGFPEDGCEGGMRRRLRHLLDTGDFQPTAEMLELAGR